MINKLWTSVILENYNNWYPLTGKNYRNTTAIYTDMT